MKVCDDVMPRDGALDYDTPAVCQIGKTLCR